MIIKPIASDSLGVRSMATYIETKECKILIDPSVAFTPLRYGLPPHKKELDTFYNKKSEIAKIAKKCNIIIISHYHYDHYDPNEKIYDGKKIFTKNILKNINKSQKQRGKEFIEKINTKCKLTYSDNTKHNFGTTKITFSPPFFHGPENIRLGYVIMTTIEEKKQKILHSSDVQGPVIKNTTEYIIKQNPDVLILDGPPSMFLGWRFSKKNLQYSSDNLIRILKETKSEIILDHHLLRDLKYKDIYSEPFKKAKKRVKTFAEYLGKKNNTLEAHRKQLWGK